MQLEGGVLRGSGIYPFATLQGIRKSFDKSKLKETKNWKNSWQFFCKIDGWLISSHVPLYSVVESTQRVYGLRLIFVSERTNKRHHHLIGVSSSWNCVCLDIWTVAIFAVWWTVAIFAFWLPNQEVAGSNLNSGLPCGKYAGPGFEPDLRLWKSVGRGFEKLFTQ